MTNRNRQARWSLYGTPDQLGVLNVGGRLGTASGPKFFRQALSRLSGKVSVLDTMLDRGDLVPSRRDLGVSHRQAADAIRDSHRETQLSVVVGGGNDYAYAQLLGIAETLPQGAKLGCINIDGHLDVRKPAPLVTSGSPFYLALEQGLIEPERFVEFGIQAHCNGPALWEYIAAKKVRVVMLEEARKAGVFAEEISKLAATCDVVVVCLDLDAAAQTFAPGVSAPLADGFTPEQLLSMMRVAGSEPKATSLGIYELNPEHDIDRRTAILAATAAWEFITAKGV